MKRILLFLMAAVLLCACHHKKAPQKVEPVNYVVNVTECISSDNADMVAKYGDYTWYETQVLLHNFLDEEYAGIDEATNVFQIVDSTNGGFDTKVIKYIHTTSGNTIEETPGFWIEDFKLDSIAITFEHSLDIINQVNCVKPHSRHIVLRNPIGPNKVNGQWVYGNMQSQLWVDAITGIVVDSNPAFPQ